MGPHIVDIGPRVPRRRHPLLRWGASALMRLAGWRVEAHLPDEPRMVVLAAPHTSNWDGWYAILAMLVMELKMGLFVKDTAFKGIVGRWLRGVGAIPIDRTAPGGLVSQTVEAFATNEQLVIGIAPEGTRRRVQKWKRGFYLIAHASKVPLVCAYVDYATRTVGTGLTLRTSGDYEKDLAAIQAFYRTITPHNPENFSTGD
jgi:1-acyl-sn-glycerol-3-phosphate acyltransferase